MNPLSLLLAMGCGNLGAPPEPPQPLVPSLITATDLQGHVEVLASDAYEGRGTGEPGLEKAADYLTGAYASMGLQPLPGHDDFRVGYTLFRTGFDPVASSMGTKDQPWMLGRDFEPFDFSESGHVDAPVVFVGYGITSEEHDWDDYQGVDVVGRVVLMLRHEPNEADEDSVFDGVRNTSHATFRSKAANAQQHGAVAMLLVTDPAHHEAADDFRGGGRLTSEPPDEAAEPSEQDAFVAVHVSRAVAQSLLSASGRDLLTLQQRIDQSGPAPIELERSVRIDVVSQVEAQPVPVANVMGFVEGADPALRDEWVVIGAHYDHLGAFTGEGDTIYNGADDNASGTAGLLELAEAFAAGERPSRSVVFAAFSGEEKGLLGSKAAVRDGVLGPDRVVFMLNLDMIGRNGPAPVELIGDGYSSGLADLASASTPDGLAVKLWGDGYKGSSDHDPFYRAAVPFVHLFTGLHDDYHQLSDHSDKLDYDRMALIVQLAHGIVAGVASADVSPGFVHHISWLGASVERREGRVLFMSVESPSRAEAAGLMVGDELRSVGDFNLADHSVLDSLATVVPGDDVELTIGRGATERTVPVKRAKPGYLGVWPANVDEEVSERFGLGPDEGVVLVQVLEDGPAAAAGLQDDDIVYRLQGHSVGRSTLTASLQRIGADERVSVDVIRGEERLTLSLVLGARP